MAAMLWLIIKYLFLFSVGAGAVMLVLYVVGGALGMVFILVSPILIGAHLLLRLCYSILHHYGFDKKGRVGWLVRATNFYYKYPDVIEGEIRDYEAMRLQNGLPPYSTWEWVQTFKDDRYAEFYQRMVSSGVIDPAATRSSTSNNSREEEPPKAKSDVTDPYTVLGVSKKASLDEIKAAYRSLMKTNHPDRVAGLDSALHQFATDRTRQIRQAFEQLSGSTS